MILVTHALLSVHGISGLPSSSSKLMTTVRRWMVSISISLYHAQNLSSLTKIPLRIVTLPTLPKPGILMGWKIGLSPWRYSMTGASLPRPSISQHRRLRAGPKSETSERAKPGLACHRPSFPPRFAR